MNLKKVIFIMLSSFILIFLNQNMAYAAKEVIRYSEEFDYPPFTYVKDGALSGFEVDLIKAVFKDERYDLKISYEMWETVYKKTVLGEVDSCGILGINEKRKSEILFSKPVLKFNTAIYTRKDSPKVTLENLREFRIGVGKEHYTEAILRNDLGITNYSSYETMDQALDALNSRQIDVLFENQEVVNYFLSKKDLTSEILPQQINLFSLDAAFGVSKKRPELVGYINKRLDELRQSGEFEELYQKYFYTNSEAYKQKTQKNIIIFSIIGVISFIGAAVLVRFYIRRLSNKLVMEKVLSSAIFDNADIFLAALKEDGTVLKFNGFVEKLAGLTIKELEGKNINNYFPKFFDLFSDIPDLKSLIDNNSFPKTIEVKTGKDIGYSNTIFIQKSMLFENDIGKPVVVLVGIDISMQAEFEKELKMSYQELEATYQQLAATEEDLEEKYVELEKSQKELWQSEERYRLVSEATNDTIWVWDVNSDEIFLSGRLSETLGLNSNIQNLKTVELANMIYSEDLEKIKNLIKEHSEKKTNHFECEYRIKSPNGETKWILARGKGIYDENGNLTGMAGSQTDITDKRKMEERINRLAYYDELTGLPNRTTLYDKLKASIDNSREAGKKSGVLFIDIDNFKYVNDCFGHSIGDLLLREVGRLFDSKFGAEYTVARLGGDEFVVILDEIHDASIAEHVAEEIISIFDSHINIFGISINITVSIGIALYPDNGIDADEVLRCADIALYDAKGLGKKNYRLYDHEIRKRVIRKMRIEELTRHALENKELELYFQPQIDISNVSIRGFETLLRWTNSDLGAISPAEFVPVAEETGLIVPIGLWVLHNACSKIIEINHKFSTQYIISVNISAVQLRQKGFINQVEEILDQTGLAPNLLEIEITESVFIESFEETNKILEDLKGLGVKISLDDFGTGYSSLAYLKRLPIDTLKIDKAFVCDISANSANAILAETIVNMAHKLNLEVIAEGVESLAQLKYLEDFGCDYIQGYLFSKPVSETEVNSYIEAKLKVN